MEITGHYLFFNFDVLSGFAVCLRVASFAGLSMYTSIAWQGRALAICTQQPARRAAATTGLLEYKVPSGTAARLVFLILAFFIYEFIGLTVQGREGGTVTILTAICAHHHQGLLVLAAARACVHISIPLEAWIIRIRSA